MNFQMVSFAANFEDVILERAFRGANRGFYIDVGAYDPVEHSVTNHFYQKGWSGVNIEPNPSPFETLAHARPRDVNLNIGLSNRNGELTVYEASSACWSVDRDLLTGWFGASPDRLVEKSIPVRTLAAICEQYVAPGVVIDFVKIDVEGHEREVVEGGDWRRWRPRVLLIEANGPESWEPQLLDAGYVFAFFDGVNRFYVREEDRALLPVIGVPANVSDAFLIHGYLRRIAELERQLDDVAAIGPAALGLAWRCHRASESHPKVASVLRRLLSPLIRLCKNELVLDQAGRRFAGGR
jgi:FkbM family methyltransferase